jgi:hypothetical protein
VYCLSRGAKLTTQDHDFRPQKAFDESLGPVFGLDFEKTGENRSVVPPRYLLYS